MNEVARKLADWWQGKGQQEYSSKAAFARAIGASYPAVKLWFRASHARAAFPRNEQCEVLFTQTGLEIFSAEKRDAARAEFEKSIPASVKKKRRAEYLENAESHRKASRDSWRKKYEEQRRFVTHEELKTIRADPRLRKNVCRNCGEILPGDAGPHIGRCPVEPMKVKLYKEKWGFLRSRNATRSEETNAKQRAVMKASGHRPPKETRAFLPFAQKASLATNQRGSARLEERLKARGKKLDARPQFWKKTSNGDAVKDARIAQLRLRGESCAEIAELVGMTLTPIFVRLKRMGFPRRARFFLHGEPVSGRTFRALMSDFGLSVKQTAGRVGVSVEWAKERLMNDGGKEWVYPDLARGILNARKILLAEFRRKPAAGEKGGRPKLLTSGNEQQMIERYKAMRIDLKALRAWIHDQKGQPSIAAIWDFLCGQFRAEHFRSLQFSPKFFDWIAENYEVKHFRSGEWIPRDLAIAFVASDFDVSENFVSDFLSHHPRSE